MWDCEGPSGIGKSGQERERDKPGGTGRGEGKLIHCKGSPVEEGGTAEAAEMGRETVL